MATSSKPGPEASTRILNAAVRVFAARGYAATSVQELLRGTGYSKPTLYYHFGSKAGLFRAILDFAYDEVFRLMRDSGQGRGEAGERLARATMAIFTFATTHQDLTRLVFASMFAAPGEIPAGVLDAARRRRNTEFLHSIVRQGQEGGELRQDVDAHDLLNGILGAVSHRVRTHLLEPRGALDWKTAQLTVQLFMNGARRTR